MSFLVVVKIIGDYLSYLDYYEYPFLFTCLIMFFVIGFILFLNWILGSKHVSLPTKEEENFEKNAFNFNSHDFRLIEDIKPKQVSLTTKVILGLLTLLLIYTPIEELIGITKGFTYHSVWYKFW